MSKGAAYFPNFSTERVAVTDPDNARSLTGYFEALFNCQNGNGAHPDHATLFERLRKDKGLPASQVHLIVGKNHLAETCQYSNAAGYGAAHGATVYLDTSVSYPCTCNVDCQPDSIEEGYGGNDDVLTDYAIQIMTTEYPAFLDLNLPENDHTRHKLMSFFCNDTLAYWTEAERVVDNAFQNVRELYEACAADTMLAGKTLLIVFADHGFHRAGQNPPGCLTCTAGYRKHGHLCNGVLCSGCEDIWMYIIPVGDNPDVIGGTYYDSFTFEHLAVTAGMIYNMEDFGEVEPIRHIFGITDVPLPPTEIQTVPSSWGSIKGLFSDTCCEDD